MFQGSSDSVRTYFIKFALSFLIAGDNEVIRNILELKSECSKIEITSSIEMQKTGSVFCPQSVQIRMCLYSYQ